MKTIEELKKIKPIVELEELTLTQELLEKIQLRSVDNARIAQENAKHIRAYRVWYMSRGFKIYGLIVEPKEKALENFPAIIWNRGGTAEFGALRDGMCFIDLARYAMQGYIVFASQYAGGPGSEGYDDMGGDTIEDVLILKKIINKWPGADAKTIGMFGWSRGGMMTYRALSLVSWIKAAVIGAGSTDEIQEAKTRKGWREHQIKRFGGSRAEQIKRSVYYWPEKLHKKTPILILQGTGDWRVEAYHALNLAPKLYEQKIPFRMHIFEGGDHALSEFEQEWKAAADKWFTRFLKNKEKLPNLKLHGK